MKSEQNRAIHAKNQMNKMSKNSAFLVMAPEELKQRGDKYIGKRLGIKDWSKQQNLQYYMDIYPAISNLTSGTRIAYQPDFSPHPVRYFSEDKVEKKYPKFDKTNLANAAFRHGLISYWYASDKPDIVVVDVDTGKNVDPEDAKIALKKLAEIAIREYGTEPLIVSSTDGRYHMYVKANEELSHAERRERVIKLAEMLSEEASAGLPEVTHKTGGKGYGRKERVSMITIDPSSNDLNKFIANPYSIKVEGGELYSRLPVTLDMLDTMSQEELEDEMKRFVRDPIYRKQQLKERQQIIDKFGEQRTAFLVGAIVAGGVAIKRGGEKVVDTVTDPFYEDAEERYKR